MLFQSLFNRMILSLAAGMLLVFSPEALSKNWVELARDVGPAEKNRNAAIAQLRKLKGLDKTLLNQIGKTHQAYALDVISALNKKELIPDLLQKISLDNSGFLILTLNSLITSPDLSLVFSHYKKLIGTDDSLSPANIVALLEPLGRLGEKLEKEDLEKLLRHPFPEVRSSVLLYARNLVLKFKNPEYHSLFKLAQNDKVYQIKQMIHSYLKELASNPKLEDSLPKNSLFVVSTIPPKFRKTGYDLRVIFGYKDTRPGRFVGDRHERIAFIQEVLKSCKNQNVSACGFRRHPKDANLLFKKTLRKNKEPIKVLLQIAHSSVSTDDLSNRKNPLQKVQSKEVENIFLDGLKNADLVFYNGHSRFGGGPDFAPPLLNVLGQVDSGFYKKYPQGINKMVNSLTKRNLDEKQNIRKLKLGIFSCSSSQHFNKTLNKLGVSEAITSPRLLHYSEALAQTKFELDSFLKKLNQDSKENTAQ